MSRDLKARWGIEARVLHDAPPPRFRPFSLADRNAVLREFATKLRLPQLADSANRPAILVSSTSWGDDEDFSVLLDAVVQYDRLVAISIVAAPLPRRTSSGRTIPGSISRPASAAVSSAAVRDYPDMVVIITGRGDRQREYMERFDALQLRHVTVRSVWLTANDYPRLLATADLGLSFHYSSSGLDLPMKVVDMFGCALPVCAINFALPGRAGGGRQERLRVRGREAAVRHVAVAVARLSRAARQAGLHARVHSQGDVAVADQLGQVGENALCAARRQTTTMTMAAKSNTMPTREELVLQYAGYPEHMAVVDNDIPAMIALLESGEPGAVNSVHYTGDTPLMLALRLNRFDMIEFLLRDSSSWTTTHNFNGETPSLLAALHCDMRVMQLLLEADAEISRSDANRNTVVHLAAMNPDARPLRLLLSRGASIHDMNNFCAQPSHVAAKNSNEAALALLLDAGCDLSATDMFGDSLANLGAKSENERVLALLIDRGVDVNGVDQFGRCPLRTAAAINTNLAVLRLLINAGADLNAVDQHGANACVFACSNPNEQVLETLLAAGGAMTKGRLSVTPCQLAASNRNEALMKRVIELGFLETNATAADCKTPLHRASEHASAAVVSLLLDNGANIHAVDRKFHNVCHFAAKNHDADVMRLLIAKGARFRAPFEPETDYTPFCAAVEADNFDVVCLLAEAGVDVGAECRTDQPLIHTAARSKDTRVLRFLIRHRADVRAVDDKGHTAHFRASAEALAVLFAHGANVAAVEPNRRLAACRAAAENNQGYDALLTLIAAGADVNVRDRVGLTAGDNVSRCEGAAIVVAAGGTTALDDVVKHQWRSLTWANQRIASRRFQLVRARALEIGIGLRSLDLPALLVCEILGACLEQLMPVSVTKFHHLWAIATAIKHFRHRQQED
jgi:ankyrin repeat protein